ncbi:MAG: hypothetical protein E6Q80_15975 [Thauera aminoaromatica]|uniref:Transposase n=1 Tax=Thauera aminoaromatica TaxID=164330 RepID=A0A5C7SHI1_THASP|nr:MAG: hypothetical protein E6Q80_15975 [Thauera aminoaromatica]
MNYMGTKVDQRPRRGTRGPCRRHTTEFKRAVVKQSRQPGASVSRLAHPHDINAKQIFAWRKGQQASTKVDWASLRSCRSSAPTPTRWTRPRCSMPQQSRSVG